MTPFFARRSSGGIKQASDSPGIQVSESPINFTWSFGSELNWTSTEHDKYEFESLKEKKINVVQSLLFFSNPQRVLLINLTEI